MQIISAISLHYGEAHVRARFTEYATRFVRLAARYEEDVLGLNTTIGYPNVSYTELPGEEPRLGSGLCFTDEAAGVRELAANASRIEAWRRTESYVLWQQVRQSSFDVQEETSQEWHRISKNYEPRTLYRA